MFRFLLLSLFAVASVAHSAQPSFVWIIADDMSPDTRAYGLEQVQTPHLDALAAAGVRYERAYATAPVCSASRSAFILGCYQTTTGLHPHDVENPQPLPAPYQALPTLLREAGWYVTNASARDTVRSGKVVKKAKTHYNFTHDPKTFFDGDDWTQRKPGQPFFAQYQVTEPHRVFPIPETFDEAKLAAIQLPANYPDHPLVRRDWYAYQRSVEVVDQRVGRIVDELREAGVLENTILFFFADHGRPMPWGKQWLTVEGLRVPLIIRGPGFATGAVEQQLTSLIDLAPTMLTLAGLQVPQWMEGLDVRGDAFRAREQVFAARDRCGDAMDRIRAVITRDHWLVKNFNPALPYMNWSSYKEEQYPGLPLLRELHRAGELNSQQSAWLAEERAELELYDLRRDPLGLSNIASAEQAAALQARLQQWLQETNDQGQGGDPATEPAFSEMQKSKRAVYQRGWEKRLGKKDPTDAERVSWWMKRYGLDG
jgi:N-sulfoglucosamine sulfohydrolase